MRGGVALAAVLLGLLPASALASGAYWGFGVPGQSSATITWQPDDGQKVNAVRFTLPVKVKSAKTRLGRKCTVPRKHPHQVRCTISPAGSYGYIDVRTKTHIPCDAQFGFSARPVGASAFVRQTPLRSANACG